MDAVPPPLPSAPKAVFRLRWYVWLGWLLGALMLVWWMVWRPNGGRLDAYQTGRAVGLALGALLLPTLASWLLWRFSGRTAVARDVGFFAMLALVLLGNIAGQVMRTRLAALQATTAQRNIERLRREAAANGKEPDAEAIRAEQRKAAAARQEMARNSSAEDRAVIEADDAVAAAMREAKNAYEAAVRELHLDKFFQLDRFEQKEAIAEDRARVRAFLAANKAFQDRIVLGAFDFSRELRARHVSERQVEQAIANYRINTTDKLGPVGRIRALDGEFGQVMLEFLDFAQDNFGEWTVSNNGARVLFRNADAPARYNAVMQRLRDVQARQAAAQRELTGRGALATKAKAGN